jgi:hypothetical protein
MQVDMKDTLAGRTAVIDSLHRPCQRFAANPGTYRAIIQVLVIRDGMVMCQQNEPALIR